MRGTKRSKNKKVTTEEVKIAFRMSDSPTNFLSLHVMLDEITKQLREKYNRLKGNIGDKIWDKILNDCNENEEDRLKSKDPNDWDLTLLCFVLKHTQSEKRRSKEISLLRNQIIHLPFPLKITDNEFNEFSNKLTSIIKKLKASNYDFSECKENMYQVINLVEADVNTIYRDKVSQKSIENQLKREKKNTRHIIYHWKKKRNKHAKLF